MQFLAITHCGFYIIFKHLLWKSIIFSIKITRNFIGQKYTMCDKMDLNKVSVSLKNSYVTWGTKNIDSV
jgi:hypothetical protein